MAHGKYYSNFGLMNLFLSVTLRKVIELKKLQKERKKRKNYNYEKLNGISVK